MRRKVGVDDGANAALGLELAQDLEHLELIFVVKVAFGFIKHEKLGVARESTRDERQLQLAPRDLIAPGVCKVRETHGFKRFVGALPVLASGPGKKA